MSDMEDSAIFAWLEQLDDLDYYELLNIEPSATADEVKGAFHTFATTFHPDGHAGRSDEERVALDAIFKRGTEAYMILSEPALRAEYDRQLAARQPSAPAPPRMQTMPPNAAARASQLPPKLEDKVHTPSARPFARRAEELVEKGDFKQAKLQMVMATHMDPENDALQEYLRHIEEQLKTSKR